MKVSLLLLLIVLMVFSLPKCVLKIADIEVGAHYAIYTEPRLRYKGRFVLFFILDWEVEDVFRPMHLTEKLTIHLSPGLGTTATKTDLTFLLHLLCGAFYSDNLSFLKHT